MMFLREEEDEDSFYGKFQTYKRSRGETLGSISQKLKIDVRTLRDYHNMRCMIADLIEKDFRPYTRFLILAPQKSVSNQDKPTVKKPDQVNLTMNYRLPFLPRQIEKDYAVEYIFKIGKSTDAMSMGMKVKWLATDVNNYHLMEIRKSVNLFIDDETPDGIMDEIGVLMVQVLYPLKIVVDQHGKWVAIHNHEEIVSRLENKKNTMLQSYQNGIVPEYIEHCEASLSNKDLLFDLLKSDYFLRSFFNGIHMGYTANYVFDNQICFPLLAGKESHFKIKQKVASHLDESGFIKVEQIGDYINSANNPDFKVESFDRNYCATYFLNPDSYFMEKMNLKCQINFDITMKLEINIATIER